MPTLCVFEFDRPDPIYYSGETVYGKIILKTEKVKIVRAIHITFNGEAKVRWSEKRTRRINGKTHHYTVDYRGHQQYLHSRTNVFGEGELPIGTHVYTYAIPIPPGCPTSCSDKYGHISYKILLTLDRPLRFDNQFTQPITVIHQLNLNLNPEYLIPTCAEELKHFCCWPCSSGPVRAVLTLPFSGYAPGQQVKFQLEINNTSTKYDIDKCLVHLRQHYKFHSETPQHKTKTTENTLVTESVGGALRLTKKLHDGTLLIPSVPPTTTDPSCIVKVAYDLEVEIETGNCHNNCEISIPITIGTIPLVASATNPNNVIVVQPTAPAFVDGVTDGSDFPPTYDRCVPPSFEEAVGIQDKFIDTDIDEINRIDGFIPKYPVYRNFGASAPPATDNKDNSGIHIPTISG